MTFGVTTTRDIKIVSNFTLRPLAAAQRVAVNGHSTVFQFLIILLHKKFLQFDWLRAVIFHLKKLLRVEV